MSSLLDMYISPMISRLVSYFIILLLILFTPYWIYIPVLLLAILVFPFFWEGVLFAILINTLYGYGGGILEALRSILPLVTLGVVLVLIPIHNNLRINV